MGRLGGEVQGERSLSPAPDHREWAEQGGGGAEGVGLPGVAEGDLSGGLGLGLPFGANGEEHKREAGVEGQSAEPTASDAASVGLGTGLRKRKKAKKKKKNAQAERQSGTD